MLSSSAHSLGGRANLLTKKMSIALGDGIFGRGQSSATVPPSGMRRHSRRKERRGRERKKAASTVSRERESGVAGLGLREDFELFDRNKSPAIIYNKIMSKTCQFGHHFLVYRVVQLLPYLAMRLCTSRISYECCKTLHGY